jgi:hypothetical protein
VFQSLVGLVSLTVKTGWESATAYPDFFGGANVLGRCHLQPKRALVYASHEPELCRH